MEAFIERVVKEVFAQGKAPQELIFVLPSRRACVFLRRAVMHQMKDSAFLPEIRSIEDYIQDIADGSLIDSTQLLFELYSIYREVSPRETFSTFDVFSQWAITALQDFSEIDSALVDTEALFGNLKDLKQLNSWFLEKEPSALSIDYLRFFEQLQTLYNRLSQQLKARKIGYQGLLYREAAEQLEFYMSSLGQKHIIFAGFNALNKAEEFIFQGLLDNGLATVYWDVNDSFFDNSHIAGTFVRRYKETWPYYRNHPFLWINPTCQPADIQIIGAPKNTAQIHCAGALLAGINNLHKTALVLADESLLPMAINALPDRVEAVNITMGYPLKYLPTAQLFEAVFDLYLNREKLGKSQEKVFYHKDVLNLLGHPLLDKTLGPILGKISQHIKTENVVFISCENMEELLTKEEIDKAQNVLSLFDFPEEPTAIIEGCIALLRYLNPSFSGVDKEYLYRLYLIFQQLKTLNAAYGYLHNIKTLALFFRQVLHNEKLSFQGEPLKGLQLMGMLETRALDFEHVIITSVNEGILPAGKGVSSFIPFDIRKHFGLPTYHEKDALFAYHFHRLLQRAKSVCLLYNTETDGYGAGEKSRFITQLQMDRPNIAEQVIRPEVQQYTLPRLEIAKTPEVMATLNNLFAHGISASALSNYLYDPIQFYEKSVLKIREEVNVADAIEDQVMGTVIHEVLKGLYEPYKGCFLQPKDIDNMSLMVEPLLLKYVTVFYKKGPIETGKNHLIFEISKKHIQRFLAQEKRLLSEHNQLKILALEADMSTTLDVAGIDYPIRIRGVVDRIDSLNGVTRIIDYKTGRVLPTVLKIPDLSVVIEAYKFSKALQVMLYAYLYTSKDNTSLDKPLQAGIISFKNLHAGFLKINFSDKRGGKDHSIGAEEINQFTGKLRQLIKEILNPENPFVRQEDLPFEKK